MSIEISTNLTKKRSETIVKDLIPKSHHVGANKNRPKCSLTETGFNKLLFSLSPEREYSGERYLHLRRNLIRFFEARGFGSAEEAVDEIYNRLARKLEAGASIQNINQYAYGMARMLVCELRRKRMREREALSVFRKTEIVFNKDDENELRLICLNHCLQNLSAESRELILTYYQGDGREKIENRQRLAEKLGIPQNALRNRVVRLRDKLRVLISNNLEKSNNPATHFSLFRQL
jgi:DNA-directed RNA polymerase specialized sigma24 family protein